MSNGRKEYAVVDPNQIAEVNHLRKKDIFIISAIEFLKGVLFAKDLEATESSEEFSGFLNKYYLPFLERAFVDIISYGFVAYRFNKFSDGDIKEYIPVVVNAQFYTVLIETKANYSVVYHIQEGVGMGGNFIASPEKIDPPGMHLFVCERYAPDQVDGTLNSPLSKLITEAAFFNEIVESQVTAISQRAHPPVLLQRMTESNTHHAKFEAVAMEELLLNEEAEKVVYEEETMMDAAEKNLGKMKRLRPATSHRNQKRIVNKTNGYSRLLYQTHEDNMYIIPKGFEVCPHQPVMPEPVQNITEYETHYAEKVMALLKLPVALVLSVQRRSTVNNAQRVDNNDFVLAQRSTKEWQRILVDFVTGVYRKRFNDDDKKRKFYLRTVPFIDTFNLLLMFNQDIISQDALKKRVIEINNLENSDIANGPNRIEKVPFNGSERHTTPYMEAAIKNLKADTEFKKRQSSDIQQKTQPEIKQIQADATYKRKQAEHVGKEGGAPPAKKSKS